MRVQVVECSRCGKRYDVTDKQPHVRIELQEIDPKDTEQIRPIRGPVADLCPPCVKSLNDWLSESVGNHVQLKMPVTKTAGSKTLAVA